MIIEKREIEEKQGLVKTVEDTKYKEKTVGQSHKHKKSSEIVLGLIILILFIILTAWYSRQPRVCPHKTRQDCFSEYIYDRFPLILRDTFLIACVFSLIFCITMSSILSRQYFIGSIGYFSFMIWFYHQPPDEYDFSYVSSYLLANFTAIMTAALLGFFAWGYFFCNSIVKKWFVDFILINIIIILVLAMKVLNIASDKSNWIQGIDGKRVLDISPTGEKYCHLQIPQYDWINFLSGSIDLTYHFYDCTKKEFTDYENNREILKKYVNDYDQGRYIVFPNFKEFTKTFSRADTQDYFLAEAKVYKDKKDVPAQFEYILDKETLQYEQIQNLQRINLNFDKDVFLTRQGLYNQFKTKFKKQNLGREPVKNVIIFYIDALSRVNLRRKLPNLFKWYSKFAQANKKEFQVFQGMRAHALASFTYHNILAYLFGAVSERSIAHHSPYSLTEGETDIYEESVINEQTGKTVVQKRNAGRKHYKAFNEYFKDSGFVTGFTNTDCATSPLTQEGTTLSFLKPIVYDHNGFIPACDPNYFLPYYQSSQGNGPYGATRRCLYGTEVIDYSLEYARQFFTKYNESAKLFEFEMIEAHERSQDVIQYADDKIVTFFTWLKDNGHFEDSVLLFLSDHGYHMTTLLNDFVDNRIYEEDNGFPIQILIADRDLLTKDDQANLKENEQRITTMFEIHYFFKYLISSDTPEYYRVNSLVSDKIPANRSSRDLPKLDALPKICLNRK